MAMLAEVHVGTAKDDDDKTDLRVNYPCPFTQVIREIRCQVKTGASFSTNARDRRRLDVGAKTRARWSENHDPTLVVWIPGGLSEARYAVIPPRRTRKRPIYLADYATITPAMLFDVARRHHIMDGKDQPRRRKLAPVGSLREAMGRLRSTRADFGVMRSGKVLRRIRLPVRAQRHVSRRSRSRLTRILSGAVTPHLSAILASCPARHQVLDQTTALVGARTKIDRTLLLVFRDAFSVSGVSQRLFVRVRESVAFPSRWREALLALDGPHAGSIDCATAIESWYLKP